MLCCCGAVESGAELASCKHGAKSQARHRRRTNPAFTTETETAVMIKSVLHLQTAAAAHSAIQNRIGLNRVETFSNAAGSPVFICAFGGKRWRLVAGGRLSRRWWRGNAGGPTAASRVHQLSLLHLGVCHWTLCTLLAHLEWTKSYTVGLYVALGCTFSA